MARIVYGTTANNRTTVTHSATASSIATAGNVVRYYALNPNNEPVRITLETLNDLEATFSIFETREGSRHTAHSGGYELEGSTFVLPENSAIPFQIRVDTPDSTAGDNQFHITASPAHTSVGLTGNVIFIARVGDGFSDVFNNL